MDERQKPVSSPLSISLNPCQYILHMAVTSFATVVAPHTGIIETGLSVFERKDNLLHNANGIPTLYLS